MLDGGAPTSENDPGNGAGEDHEDRPKNLGDPGRQTCEEPRVGPSQKAPEHSGSDEDGDGQQRKPHYAPDRRAHEHEPNQKPRRDESIPDEEPGGTTKQCVRHDGDRPYGACGAPLPGAGNMRDPTSASPGQRCPVIRCGVEIP